MIYQATTMEELSYIAPLAERWGERQESWSLPFSRNWFLRLWGNMLSSPTNAVLYQMKPTEVVGAIGLTVSHGLDAEPEVREVFWVGGDRRLLRAAEKWAEEVGARRIIIGCPEGPHVEGLSRLHSRDGYEATERIFCKELV